jgi:hypothetical protein
MDTQSRQKAILPNPSQTFETSDVRKMKRNRTLLAILIPSSCCCLIVAGITAIALFFADVIIPYFQGLQ